MRCQGGGYGCAVICRAVGRAVDEVKECRCRRGGVDVLQRVSRVALCRHGFEGAAVVRVRGRAEEQWMVRVGVW